MNADILFNLFNELKKSHKIETYRAFYCMFETRLINLTRVRLYLSYDIKITAK